MPYAELLRRNKYGRYIFNENNGLWYELVGDYSLPMLTVEADDWGPIGIWGDCWKKLLEKGMDTFYKNRILLKLYGKNRRWH